MALSELGYKSYRHLECFRGQFFPLSCPCFVKEVLRNTVCLSSLPLMCYSRHI